MVKGALIQHSLQSDSFTRGTCRAVPQTAGRSEGALGHLPSRPLARDASASGDCIISSNHAIHLLGMLAVRELSMTTRLTTHR